MSVRSLAIGAALVGSLVTVATCVPASEAPRDESAGEAIPAADARLEADAGTTPFALDRERGVLTLAPVLERVTPAVVNISVRSRIPARRNPLFEDPFFRRFFDLPAQPPVREVLSAGSGVIVDADRGLVLTNHHVIEKASEVRVTLKDRRTFPAELVGSDPDTDLALLRVEADDLSDLPMGDSDAVEVGDLVLAIGNPFGIGQTVTSGIVSAVGRSGLGLEGYEDFIQTDASINPGNSGGALVNSKGELVGINTAIIGPSGGNVGIGFAVPSNMARGVMEQLSAYGEVRRGRLGVVTQDLTPELAHALNLERTAGAVITRVEPDSAAAEAGLEAGDVIVGVNGREVRDAAHLHSVIGLAHAGESLHLRFYRDGRPREVEAMMRDAQPAALAVGSIVPELSGATFEDRDLQSPAYGRIEGVVIAKVERGSPAWRHGLRAGDVVVGVNRHKIASVDEFRAALEGGASATMLHLLRGRQQMVVVIPVGNFATAAPDPRRGVIRRR